MAYAMDQDPIKSLYEAAIHLEEAQAGEPLHGIVELDASLNMAYQVSVTNKGNGILKIGGLEIHSHDTHNDGKIFAGGTLDHEFVDLNGDGVMDLRITGLAIVFDEKGDLVIEQLPIIAEFTCNVATSTFTQSRHSPFLLVRKRMP